MAFSFENTCALPLEKLPFTFYGLCLQEPMALLLNWVMAATSFYFFIRINKPVTNFQKYWRLFYLNFGISTFFGGLGHLFFNYFDVYGKYPCWVFGVFAAYFAGKAMISVPLISESLQKKIGIFLIVKAMFFAVGAVISQSFLFVMMDAIITYLFFCMGFGLYYWKKGMDSFRFTVYAVLILIPSLFIFLFKINPHLWFNKDDLSHVFMVLTIVFFYVGIIKFTDRSSNTQLL